MEVVHLLGGLHIGIADRGQGVLVALQPPHVLVDPLEHQLGLDLLIRVALLLHGGGDLGLLGIVLGGHLLDRLIPRVQRLARLPGSLDLVEPVLDPVKGALHRRGLRVQAAHRHRRAGAGGQVPHVRLMLQPLVGVDVQPGHVGVDAAPCLLRHVGQLVLNQMAALLRVRLELARGELHHVALGKRPGVHIGRLGGLSQLHLIHTDAELLLHPLCHLRVQIQPAPGMGLHVLDRIEAALNHLGPRCIHGRRRRRLLSRGNCRRLLLTRHISLSHCASSLSAPAGLVRHIRTSTACGVPLVFFIISYRPELHSAF